MRPVFQLIATATALIAGSALAAPADSSQAASAGKSAPPSAKTATGADASATAGGFAVGMPVKDNTGATIGSIASLGSDAGGNQTAVIKMGADQFQLQTSKLNQTGGAAVINLTQAQITAILHRSAGAAAPGGAAGGAGAGGGAAPGSTKQ
ncbi:MAG TPA: hypothetical protein VN694_01615 [Caulobacteraceae bacterium]|nr:hypothetical protein [Caulobacteraceae bacterium]